MTCLSLWSVFNSRRPVGPKKELFPWPGSDIFLPRPLYSLISIPLDPPIEYWGGYLPFFFVGYEDFSPFSFMKTLFLFFHEDFIYGAETFSFERVICSFTAVKDQYAEFIQTRTWFSRLNDDVGVSLSFSKNRISTWMWGITLFFQKQNLYVNRLSLSVKPVKPERQVL